MALEHAARTWVETNFPGVTGLAKAALMLAFGAGMDAGLAEATRMITEAFLMDG